MTTTTFICQKGRKEQWMWVCGLVNSNLLGNMDRVDNNESDSTSYTSDGINGPIFLS